MTMFARTLAVVAVVGFTLAGCGSDSEDTSTTAADSTAPATDPPAPTTDPPPSEPVATEPAPTDLTAPVTNSGESPSADLADGPVTVVALGDSLTEAVGDETGRGFVGLVTEAIDAVPGRSGSSLVNLGVSGVDSSAMVDGGAAQLAPAVEAVESAVADGRAVLATVLIGSNDLWYLYEYPEVTGPAEEDAAAETYRSNLERTVSELTEAGAVVVLGLPDDQMLRPMSLDIAYLNGFFPNITTEEIQQMSAMSARFDRVAEEVAAEHDLRTVDTNLPFWSDTAKMDEDLGHPNEAGYAELAEPWIAAVEGLL